MAVSIGGLVASVVLLLGGGGGGTADRASQISAWIDDLASQHAAVRAGAVEGLVRLGPQAVPALVGALEGPNATVRCEAATALGRMGAEAAPAVGTLAGMLRQGDGRRQLWAAGGALARIGPAAIPTLTELLDCDQPRVRGTAAVALAATGSRGEAVLADALGPQDVDHLVEAFDCRDKQFPWWTARALEIVGPEAVPALADALAAGDDNRQMAVIAALIRMKKAAHAAVPALVEALEDDNREVRRRAIYALSRVGWSSRQAVPALIEIVRHDPDVVIRQTAIRVLARYGPEAKGAVADLLEAMTVKHPTVTKMAAEALHAIGPAALPAVIAGLGHPHPEVRRGCAMTMAAMGEAALPRLLDVLAHGDVLARAAAADALGRIGPTARRAVPALEAVAADDQLAAELRRAARSALEKITLEKRPGAPPERPGTRLPETPSKKPGDARPEPGVKAFPGAEGFGAYARGGRGGRVILVTNLEDSGPGSLRAACEAAGPRIVVFRVSGIIELDERLKIHEPFITVAGQTAPGGGICLKNYGLRVGNTHDVIIHHLRIRPGDLVRKSQDAVNVVDSRRVILDHCSISWGTDETLSSSGELEVTIGWCMITEGLPNGRHVKEVHGKGSLLTGDRGGITLHHCIYAHQQRRTPRVGGIFEDLPGITLDCRNNVVYNWGDKAAQTTDDPVKVNFVGNYLKPGPSTWPEARRIAFTPGGPLTRLFMRDNHIEGVGGKGRDPWQMVAFPYGGSEAEIRSDEPFPAPPVATDSPQSAFDRTLAGAGATLPARDAVDARIVRQIRRGSGQIVDSQTAVGGWPSYPQAQPPADTDRDGMPDAWEERFGLDPRNRSDNARDADQDGYTNVEEYLNATDPRVRDTQGGRTRKGDSVAS